MNTEAEHAERLGARAGGEDEAAKSVKSAEPRSEKFRELKEAKSSEP
jgi:hypothetical protein